MHRRKRFGQKDTFDMGKLLAKDQLHVVLFGMNSNTRRSLTVRSIAACSASYPRGSEIWMRW
jgi:hypothetical protein